MKEGWEGLLLISKERNGLESDLKACGTFPKGHHSSLDYTKSSPLLWYARQDLNLRPLAPEASALSGLSYGRYGGSGIRTRG